MQLSCGFIISMLGVATQITDRFRQNIGSDRNDTFGSHGHERQGERVVAAIDLDLVAAETEDFLHFVE